VRFVLYVLRKTEAEQNVSAGCSYFFNITGISVVLIFSGVTSYVYLKRDTMWGIQKMNGTGEKKWWYPIAVIVMVCGFCGGIDVYYNGRITWSF